MLRQLDFFTFQIHINKATGNIDNVNIGIKKDYESKPSIQIEYGFLKVKNGRSNVISKSSSQN